MSDFRILTSLEKPLGRFVERAIDSHVMDDVAHLAATRTTGVTNPVGVIAGIGSAGLLNRGIFNPRVFEHTTSAVIRGNGGSALDDSVRALHNLGERHGVAGISLLDDPNYAGLILKKGGIGYEGGGNILRELGKGDIEKGRAIAMRIDSAARRVLDFVPEPLVK
jgi:hypothetical protein